MNSPIWPALYCGGLAVVLAAAALPGWVVMLAALAVIVGYGLHLRLALRMIDEWYAKVDRGG